MIFIPGSEWLVCGGSYGNNGHPRSPRLHRLLIRRRQVLVFPARLAHSCRGPYNLTQITSFHIFQSRPREKTDRSAGVATFGERSWDCISSRSSVIISLMTW